MDPRAASPWCHFWWPNHWPITPEATYSNYGEHGHPNYIANMEVGS